LALVNGGEIITADGAVKFLCEPFDEAGFMELVLAFEDGYFAS
jgi:hypothetical protein